MRVVHKRDIIPLKHSAEEREIPLSTGLIGETPLETCQLRINLSSSSSGSMKPSAECCSGGLPPFAEPAPQELLHWEVVNCELHLLVG